MTRLNEARSVVWHETCKCICRLISAICNSRQIWNENACRCEFQEDLTDKLTCDKGYIWNPSSCSCECDKLCDVGQYLDYKNSVCENKLLNNLVEECINIVDGELVYDKRELASDCPSHMPYIVLFSVFLLISSVLGSVFIYYRRYKNRKNDVPTVT